jgi:hypothetical protein
MDDAEPSKFPATNNIFERLGSPLNLTGMTMRSVTIFTHDLKGIELTVLYDLLASYTVYYTRIMNEGGHAGEFHQYKEAIERLQAEISSRQTQKSDN